MTHRCQAQTSPSEQNTGEYKQNLLINDSFVFIKQSGKKIRMLAAAVALWTTFSRMLDTSKLNK